MKISALKSASVLLAIGFCAKDSPSLSAAEPLQVVRASKPAGLGLLEDRVIYKDPVWSGRFPTGGQFADGTLFTAFSVGKEHVGASRRATTWSRDGGRTWEQPLITGADKAPGQLNQLPDGIVASVRVWDRTPFLVSETRDGDTWTEPKRDTLDAERPLFRWGRIVALSSNHWLYPLYTLNKGDESKGQRPKGDGAYCYETLDRGGSWKKLATITGPIGARGVSESFLFRTLRGKLAAFIRTSNDAENDTPGQPVAVSTSKDDGKTWSPVELTKVDIGQSPTFALQLKSGKVLWTYGYRLKPFGCRARLLDAECENLETAPELVINDQGASWDCGQPWATQLANGDIIVVYYMQTETDRFGKAEIRMARLREEQP